MTTRIENCFTYKDLRKIFIAAEIKETIGIVDIFSSWYTDTGKKRDYYSFSLSIENIKDIVKFFQRLEKLLILK